MMEDVISIHMLLFFMQFSHILCMMNSFIESGYDIWGHGYGSQYGYAHTNAKWGS